MFLYLSKYNIVTNAFFIIFLMITSKLKYREREKHREVEIL